MSRPRIEDIEVPASASDDDVPTVVGGVLAYVPLGSGTPTGPAGGVLSGTYPNPGFAADMATQAELDAVEAAVPTTAGVLTTTYLPLTTVVGGVPELVWDADDSLIPTEVPL